MNVNVGFVVGLDIETFKLLLRRLRDQIEFVSPHLAKTLRLSSTRRPSHSLRRYKPVWFTHTTCLTYDRKIPSAQCSLVEAWSAGILDLEEAFEPPDQEDALSHQDAQLEDAPPLDPCVGALGRVAVRPFAHDHVRLFVFDLGEEFDQFPDCSSMCGQQMSSQFDQKIFFVAHTLLV